MPSPGFSQQRAGRYRQALERVPAARTMELLALLPLCWPRHIGGIAVDLGAGTGYLSTVLETLYADVVRVDNSLAMLGNDDSGVPLLSEMGDAAGKLDPGLMPDLVVSLGTLHHVHDMDDESEGEEPADSHCLQQKCIKSWVDRLTPGGRFVVADIGRPQDLSPDYLKRVQEDFTESASLEWDAIESLDESLPRYQFGDTARLLGLQYRSLSISSLAAALAERDWRVDADGPVTFFDTVVRRRSVDGHRASFIHEGSMRRLLEGTGLENVVTGVVPTPWLFGNEQLASWFINEFFALTPIPYDYGIGREEMSAEVSAEVAHTLPIRSLEDKSAIPWQLVFAEGTKK